MQPHVHLHKNVNHKQDYVVNFNETVHVIEVTPARGNMEQVTPEN